MKYLGAQTTPQQALALAEAYYAAAHALIKLGQRGKPASRAPCRLCAIHAIELYLTALLLHHGTSAADIRSLQHSLAKRIDLALESGIKLRAETLKHLRTLDEKREYLVTRYAHDELNELTPLNRLTSTLDEVAKKVPLLIKLAAAKTNPAGPSR